MEIISKESIKPSSPTPDHLRTFRLSLLDQFFPPNNSFSLVIYYTHDNTVSLNIKQAEISPLLKRSLSDALVLYYPLAGRMKGETSIDCGDQGVDFFEARVDASLQDIIESARVEVLTEFVPKSNAESGTGALLGIQLNRFNCGGIGIGITLWHRMGDACTLSMFLKAWAAAMARGGTVAPSFVASTLFPPNEALRHHGQVQKTIETTPKLPWGHTRRFRFSSSKIAALKAAVETSDVVQVVKPSRVEVVTAAIWKWLMARKGSLKVKHAVNIRRRMDPPLSENVFGNLLQPAEASGNGEMEMGELVSKMREAIGKLDSEFLKELQGENGYEIVSRDIKEWGKEAGNCLLFTSWCNFPFYDTDFGWGKPVWVSMASRAYGNTINLNDSIGDIGGIEAWITMNEDWTCDEL